MWGEIMVYEFKKTAWKVVKVMILGALGALISYLGAFPPEATIIATIAGITAFINYVKHMDDK